MLLNVLRHSFSCNVCQKNSCTFVAPKKTGVNRILFHLLLPLVCFNLAGGFGIAAGYVQGQSPIAVQAANPDQATVAKKEVTIVTALNQIFKEADEGSLLKLAVEAKAFLCPVPEPYVATQAKGFGIQHYLSLYDRTVKVRQPQVYLKDCVFLI